MRFKITITEEAERQFGSLPVREQRILKAAVPSRLEYQLARSATSSLWKAGNSMAIKTITLSRLETDLAKTLNECADSGETMVIEMPDRRLLAIQPLEPREVDALTDELLASNPEFQALVAKSKASPRKPFPTAANANG